MLKTDKATIDALALVTGAESVRVLRHHDEKGKPVYDDGYVEGPNDTLQFTDHNGQHRIVPIHRVAAVMPKPAGHPDAKPKVESPAK